MRAGKYRARVRFERPSSTQDPKFKSAKPTWATFADTWAEVQDVLPSKDEGIANGMSIANRPTRLRTRWVAGATSAMRIVILGTALRPERIVRIVGGPAELGRMEGMEFMVVDFSTPGGGAA